MAADGEDMTHADVVQEVTPFPLAQDLLLLSKQSLPESVLLQPAFSDVENRKQDAQELDQQPLQPLAPEHPFQPFLEGSVVSTLPTEGFNSDGDVSEKRVGEKIALFEGLAVNLHGEETEDHALPRFDSVDDSSTMLQPEETPQSGQVADDALSPQEEAVTAEEAPESAQVVDDALSPEEEGVTTEQDVLFEGLTLVDESPEAADVGLEGLAERVEVESAHDAAAVASKESDEASHGDSHTVSNGTHKIETLGEILSRDHKEEMVKGTGNETINHGPIASEGSMGSTPKGYQGNGGSVTPRAPVVNSDGNAVASHRSSTSGTNVVGDILYNIAVGDEEGRSRQRILAFAAKRYAANVERNPEDHDALYNWALVLQESADNAGPEVGSPGKDALLEEACKKYEAATQLCPTLHEAYYNWAIAISDRAKIRGRTKEAEELWKQACDRYDRAVQLNWNSPQALNNWGLALQELGAIVALKEKRAIVKKAIRKFRAAIRLRFDFHRAVYNLGTVLYGLGEDIARTGRKLSPKELTPADLNSLSAIYITAAHALKPDYPVYRGALRLVRNFLPLPYLRAGWLRIPPTGDSLAPHSDWLRLWFVLDHEALYEIDKVDRKALAHTYSRRPSTLNSESTPTSSSFATTRPSVLRIEMEDILCLAPTADLSLPPGGGFCIDTDAGPQYLIADTWDAMDAWVDAIRLVYTIYAQGKRDALANVLVV